MLTAAVTQNAARLLRPLGLYKIAVSEIRVTSHYLCLKSAKNLTVRSQSRTYRTGSECTRKDWRRYFVRRPQLWAARPESSSTCYRSHKMNKSIVTSRHSSQTQLHRVSFQRLPTPFIKTQHTGCSRLNTFAVSVAGRQIRARFSKNKDESDSPDLASSVIAQPITT
jgi:hypothetical protein